MRRLTPEEMPGMIVGLVCRQSRLVTLGVSAGMFVVLAGVPGILAWNAELPRWISLTLLAWAALISCWLARNVMKSWHSTNWLLRVAPGGLWINLRSHLNRELPPARTVIHLPYEEIQSVRAHVSKRAERTNNSIAKWTERYLDIQLVDAVPEDLRTEIAEERRRQVIRTYLWGLVTSRSRQAHSPVTVPGTNVIRLAWRGRFDWITPSLPRTLQELRRRVAIGEATQSDFSDWKSLTDAQIDSLALQLVESGDKFGAVKLLIDRRGYSTTEAHQFVEELTATL
jgi:hypothetical protein